MNHTESLELLYCGGFLEFPVNNGFVRACEQLIQTALLAGTKTVRSSTACSLFRSVDVEVSPWYHVILSDNTKQYIGDYHNPQGIPFSNVFKQYKGTTQGGF